MTRSPFAPAATLEAMTTAELVRVVTLQCAISEADQAGNRALAGAYRAEFGRLVGSIAPFHPAILSCRTSQT